jgi:phosphoribosyl 1,2-cyclic phosphate phosphodiesterase
MKGITMEAIILGTAAAEGIPALFCGCDACRSARASGGKDIRARQSLFLPPDIVVDLGPDCLYAVQRLALDWSSVSAVLYTHSHADHCIPQQLEYVRPVFANHRTANGLDVYGNEAVRSHLTAVLGEPENLRLHPAPPFQPITLPNATAVPIPSHHKSDGEETLNYLITRNGKTLLCAWDTGTYDETTWEYLQGCHVDCLLIECTFGVNARDPKWPYHLDLAGVVDIRDRLRAQGTLADAAPAIITHFSHNGIVPHDAFEDIAGVYGLSVAYDGMRLVL